MEKGGILREGWGRCGQKSRAGLCRAVRWQERALCGQGPVPAAVWPETDSLADPRALPGQGHPLSCLCHAGQGQHVPGGNYCSEVQSSYPRALGAPSTSHPTAGLWGAKTHLTIGSGGSLRRGGGRIGTGPSLQ